MRTGPERMLCDDLEMILQGFAIERAIHNGVDMHFKLYGSSALSLFSYGCEIHFCVVLIYKFIANIEQKFGILNVKDTDVCKTRRLD